MLNIKTSFNISGKVDDIANYKAHPGDICVNFHRNMHFLWDNWGFIPVKANE